MSQSSPEGIELGKGSRLVSSELSINKEKVLSIKQKETLEEAAERIFPIKLMYFPKEVIDLNEEPRNIFFKGAKWQQEQDNNKYSEEEVYNILEQAMKDAPIEGLTHHYNGDFRDLKDWFENLKR